MDRRDFLKRSGAAAMALSAAACAPKKGSQDEDCRCGDGRMPMRECGDDMVSLLGYGCMRWKMINGPDGRKIVDQDSVNELVDYAIEHVVNYFDSSPMYLQGQSEAATAKALLRHPREDYYIATKMSNFGDHSYEGSVAMYRHSLEIYQTDHIDYYLLHSIGGMDAFKSRFQNNGVIDFLMAEREAGRIRHLGFSFHGNQKGFDELVALHDMYHWDFVQIQMNYVDWNHANQRNTNASHMYEELAKRDIPMVMMEPLLGGQLARLSDSITARLKEQEPQMSVASWAFRYCGTFPKVLTILSGMTYMEHLTDNVKTFENFKPLNEKELEMLETLAGIIRSYPLVPCTACQYCMPCPYGIDIPGIFKHYNDHVNDESIPQGAEQKDFKKLKRRYLTSYDRAIESIRQADHCIECGQCAPHCPQSIAIPKELQRIDRYVEKLKRGTLD